MISPTETDVWTTICGYVRAASGVADVARAHRDFRAPPTLYAVAQRIDDVPAGANIEHPATTYQQVATTFQVSFVGDGANEAARRMLTTLPTIPDADGYQIRRTSGVRELPEDVGGARYVERAVLDVRIQYELRSTTADPATHEIAEVVVNGDAIRA